MLVTMIQNASENVVLHIRKRREQTNKSSMSVKNVAHKIIMRILSVNNTCNDNYNNEKIFKPFLKARP